MNCKFWGAFREDQSVGYELMHGVSHKLVQRKNNPNTHYIIKHIITFPIVPPIVRIIAYDHRQKCLFKREFRIKRYRTSINIHLMKMTFLTEYSH